MPGLMSIRKIRRRQAAEGRARDQLAAHDDPDRRAAVRTLKDIGGDVRWSLDHNIFSTQDHAAAVAASARRCSWKGETLEEYWDCALEAPSFPGGRAASSARSSSSTAAATVTLLIHKGLRAREGRRAGQQPPAAEEQVIKNLLKRGRAPGY